MRQSFGTGSEPKRNNKIRTARFISLRGVTSKTEISAGLKLSMPTTLQNVKALINEGIVEETGEYESTGGEGRRLCPSGVMPGMVQESISRIIISLW